MSSSAHLDGQELCATSYCSPEKACTSTGNENSICLWKRDVESTVLVKLSIFVSLCHFDGRALCHLSADFTPLLHFYVILIFVTKLAACSHHAGEMRDHWGSYCSLTASFIDTTVYMVHVSLVGLVQASQGPENPEMQPCNSPCSRQWCLQEHVHLIVSDFQMRVCCWAGPELRLGNQLLLPCMGRVNVAIIGCHFPKTVSPKLPIPSRAEPKAPLGWVWRQLSGLRWGAGCVTSATYSAGNEAMFSKYLRQRSLKSNYFVANYLGKWKNNNYLWICEDIYSSRTDGNCLV